MKIKEKWCKHNKNIKGEYHRCLTCNPLSPLERVWKEKCEIWEDIERKRRMTALSKEEELFSKKTLEEVFSLERVIEEPRLEIEMLKNQIKELKLEIAEAKEWCEHTWESKQVKQGKCPLCGKSIRPKTELPEEFDMDEVRISDLDNKLLRDSLFNRYNQLIRYLREREV